MLYWFWKKDKRSHVYSQHPSAFNTWTIMWTTGMSSTQSHYMYGQLVMDHSFSEIWIKWAIYFNDIHLDISLKIQKFSPRLSTIIIEPLSVLQINSVYSRSTVNSCIWLAKILVHMSSDVMKATYLPLYAIFNISLWYVPCLDWKKILLDRSCISPWTNWCGGRLSTTSQDGASRLRFGTLWFDCDLSRCEMLIVCMRTDS